MKKLLFLFIVLSLGACDSARQIIESECFSPRQSGACEAHCGGYGNSDRPLWCYRFFCTNGAEFSGEWCDGIDLSTLPSNADVEQIRASSSYYLATGSQGGNANFNDNNLAFVQSLFSTNSEKTISGSESHSTVFMIGNSVGYEKGMIDGDDGESANNNRLTRMHVDVFQDAGKNEGRYDVDNSVDKNPTASFLPGNQSQATGTIANWYAQDPHASSKAERAFFDRTGTSYAAAILGHEASDKKSVEKVMGFGDSNTHLVSYNALDNVRLTRNYDRSGFGANYVALVRRITLALEDIVNNRSSSDYHSAVLLSFEGFRDTSQLGQGVQFLFPDDGTTVSQEHKVSYMLTNIVQPWSTTMSPERSNATFSTAIQFGGKTDGWHYYASQDYPTAANPREGENVFSVSGTTNIAQEISESLDQRKNFIFVTGAGISGINNTGGSYDLFYDDFESEKKNSTHGDANWYNEEAWYKGQNIFQTNGALEADWYSPAVGLQTDDATGYFSTNFFGADVSKISYTESVDGLPDMSGSIYAHVTQEGSLNMPQDRIGNHEYVRNMAYTGSYPSAFLAYLWANDYSNSSGGPIVGNNIFTMNRNMVWDGNSRESEAYSIRRHYIVNSGGKEESREETIETKGFLMGAGFADASGDTLKYSNSDAYRYLVAGAVSNVNGYTDDGRESLVAYTNAAGISKYNYLSVNVNNFQRNLYQNNGGYIGIGVNKGAEKEKVHEIDSGQYTSSNGFYTINKDSQDPKGRYAVYKYSPSIFAGAVLTGYIERLEDLFRNSSGNDIAFVLRHTADQNYGRNYNMEIDGEDRSIHQATYFFTKDVNPYYKEGETSESTSNPTGSQEQIEDAWKQRSLNLLNAESGRDVFIFTGLQDDKQSYDSMRGQMFSPGTGIGEASMTGDMIAPNMYGGHGSNITSNTSFYMGIGDQELNEADHILSLKIGGKLYEKHHVNANAKRTEFNQKKMIDPDTQIQGTGAGTHANSFLTTGLGSEFNVKFNWEGKAHRYYDMGFVGCGAGIANDMCNQDEYHKHLKSYYDKLEVPEKNRNLINLKIDSDGSVHSCNDGDDCTYKYTEGGYDHISLKYFNENKNVLLLATDSDVGQYEFAGRRVNMDVFALDPALHNTLDYDVTEVSEANRNMGQYYKALDFYYDKAGIPPKDRKPININAEFDSNGNPTSVDVCQNPSKCDYDIRFTKESEDVMKFFHDLNNALDGADPEKLKELGISAIEEARISDNCINRLECTHHDLLVMFHLKPDLFDRAPSNIYGYGDVDMEAASKELMYEQNFFYANNPAGNLSRDLQQFFYNENCKGTSCGVETSQEMGFKYKPSAYGTETTDKPNVHDNPNANPDPDNPNRIVIGYVHTPYGDRTITADDINKADGAVEGYPGMMIGYLMGAFGSSYTPTDHSSFVSESFSFGGNLQLRSRSFGGKVQIGGKVLNAQDFSKHSITAVERNSDQFGFQIIEGMTMNTYGMLNGMKYNQKIGESSEFQTMFFGNKNEHDLINSNSIGKKIGDSSMYYLTSSMQGMFSNPYMRHVGGYRGSMYSYVGSLFDKKLRYRLSSIQEFNPARNLFSFDGIGRDLGLSTGGGHESNSLQELQLMHDRGRSSYSFGLGVVNEKGTVLGTNLGIGMNSTTGYADLKGIQHIGAGFHLMFHYNLGLVTPTSSISTNALHDFSTLFAHKLSVGFVKENFFNGSLFFTYTEPNRIISGTGELRTFDGNGNIVDDAGYVDFTQLTPERNYELGYSTHFKFYDLSLSAIVRTNPYSNQNVDTDGVFMCKVNGPI